jgi:ABC-type transporter Mla subunit MlaD
MEVTSGNLSTIAQTPRAPSGIVGDNPEKIAALVDQFVNGQINLDDFISQFLQLTQGSANAQSVTSLDDVIEVIKGLVSTALQLDAGSAAGPLEEAVEKLETSNRASTSDGQETNNPSRPEGPETNQSNGGSPDAPSGPTPPPGGALW